MQSRMPGLSGYVLRSLRCEVTAPRSHELERVLENVFASLPRGARPAFLRREPRRQLRVTARRAPNRWHRAARHYVFEDYTYSIVFDRPGTARLNQIVSTLLAARSEQTTLKCHFEWHYPGRKGPAMKD